MFRKAAPLRAATSLLKQQSKQHRPFRKNWHVSDWLSGEKSRRQRGVTAQSIYSQFWFKPNEMARRLLFISPLEKEAEVYERAARELFENNLPELAVKLWNVAVNFNFFSRHHLTELGLHSLRYGKIDHAIFAFEKLVNICEMAQNYHQDLLISAYTKLSAARLMKALSCQNSVKQFNCEKELALNYAKKALEYYPENKDLLLNLNVIKIVSPDFRYGEAHQYFDYLRSLHSDSSSIIKIFPLVRESLQKNCFYVEQESRTSYLFAMNEIVPILPMTFFFSKNKTHEPNLDGIEQLDKAKKAIDDPDFSKLSRLFYNYYK